MGERPVGRGLRRSWRLLRAFRREQSHPASAYRTFALDLVSQVRLYAEIRNATVLDVGGGPGYVTEAFRAAGAGLCLTVDSHAAELSLHGRTPRDALVASGAALPIAESSVDITCSSNVLEHVPNPWQLGAELLRVTRPGGVVYLSVTNWWSPLGGHETSPWHYLGGTLAARRYERHYGVAPKNLYGVSLFPIHIGQLLDWAESRGDIQVVDAFPRYLPPWSKSLLHLPLIREVAVWNLALILRPA